MIGFLYVPSPLSATQTLEADSLPALTREAFCGIDADGLREKRMMQFAAKILLSFIAEMVIPLEDQS
jgi:hypothetical protein